METSGPIRTNLAPSFLVEVFLNWSEMAACMPLPRGAYAGRWARVRPSATILVAFAGTQPQARSIVIAELESFSRPLYRDIRGLLSPSSCFCSHGTSRRHGASVVRVPDWVEALSHSLFFCLPFSFVVKKRFHAGAEASQCSHALFTTRVDDVATTPL